MKKNLNYLIVEEAVPQNRIWRIEPVGPINFMEKYIKTPTLSEPQKDVIRGIFGDDPTDRFFNVEQAILRIGQGGGKNFLISRCVVYLIYLWCCLEDPHTYFGLAESEHFDILNYSQVNAMQAKNVFFRSLTDIISVTRDPDTGENWFGKNMGLKIKKYGTRDIKDKEMIIPNRRKGKGNIRVYCLDSTAKSVEGYTIWVSIMDEPSRANTEATFAVAKHQYETAHTNQETRFSNPQHRLTLVFAYPEQKNQDLLMELFNLYSENPQENHVEIVDGVMTAWYATYVFNGKQQEAKRIAYQKYFDKDPIDANRRWRAIVPESVFGFFMPHFEKIKECANPNLVSPVQVRETITARQEKVRGEEQTCYYIGLEPTEIKGDNRERFWGADFAVKNDRLVIVGGYGERCLQDIENFTYWQRTETGEEKEQKKAVNCRPVIDIILIWVPKRAGEIINYNNVENLLMDLIKNHFPGTRAVHFDQYNTESIRQKLVDLGVRDCERLSFSNPQQVLYGRLVRHLVWNNSIEYLDNALLLREMKLLKFEKQSKLDHPPNGSKDAWDAFSICVNLIFSKWRFSGMPLVDIGEPLTPDLLDEDDEFDEFDKAEDDYDKDMKIFSDAFHNFCNTHNRKPTDEEFQDWLLNSYGAKFSLQKIRLFKDRRGAWENSGRGKMAKLGLSHPSSRNVKQRKSKSEEILDYLEDNINFDDEPELF